jgi:hypothetical protein
LGTDGTSGQNGTDGTSGSSGQNGSAGTSGTGVTLSIQDTGITSLGNINSLTFSGSISIQASGSNPNGNGALVIFGGVGGATMTSGTSGTSGISGTNGAIAITGTTNQALIVYEPLVGGGSVSPRLTFDGSVLTVSASINIYTAMRLIRRTDVTPPTPETGMLYVSASGAGGALMFYNGGSWVQIAPGL